MWEKVVKLEYCLVGVMYFQTKDQETSSPRTPWSRYLWTLSFQRNLQNLFRMAGGARSCSQLCRNLGVFSMGGKIARGKLRLVRVEALARRELSTSTHSEGSRECFSQPRSRSYGTAPAPAPSHLQLLLPLHTCSCLCPFTPAAAPSQSHLQLILPLHTCSCSYLITYAAAPATHLQLLWFFMSTAAPAPSHLQLLLPNQLHLLLPHHTCSCS